MANATIGYAQQVSHETLMEMFLLTSRILLNRENLTILLQLRVLNSLFGPVQCCKEPLDELRIHAHNLRRLISAVESA